MSTEWSQSKQTWFSLAEFLGSIKELEFRQNSLDKEFFRQRITNVIPNSWHSVSYFTSGIFLENRTFSGHLSLALVDNVHSVYSRVRHCVSAQKHVFGWNSLVVSHPFYHV